MYILIYHRTSRILTTLRYFLYPSTTANFILATLTFATQVRNVNNKESMALLCDGFCKFIGPELCFHFYVFLLNMITVSGLINLHTLCYRTMVLKYLNSKKSDRATLHFSWHYFIPLTTLILSYIPPQNHANVFMETQLLHPQYHFSIYKNFGGFANSHHFCMGLSLQVLLPLCCYVPVTILYCWNKYSGSQILISQYTLSFMGTLPCVFDPFLQIYFIMPYRTTIFKFLACSPLTPLSRSREDNSTSIFRNFWKFFGFKESPNNKILDNSLRNRNSV
ncbi:Protein CBR-SRD-61 [Caenorhabditis briggsae]|uniref:Protein CBR-SRD-61 n=1 Tax=Caenorhabditis briggsae TaxID=6238 RepID=A8WPM2_CAEBR|nr:Protein CBR-SRD-61 [Caenorhabditis briggsae]CAP22429.2 Protein CBR-SRD-61 [Caenorhabditis briggsae]